MRKGYFTAITATLAAKWVMVYVIAVGLRMSLVSRAHDSAFMDMRACVVKRLLSILGSATEVELMDVIS